jgi:L-lactate dehydrogenase (cytochrome)
MPDSTDAVDDAKMAIAAGADAILVSNHGGRQLDGALVVVRI